MKPKPKGFKPKTSSNCWQSLWGFKPGVVITRLVSTIILLSTLIASNTVWGAAESRRKSVKPLPSSWDSFLSKTDPHSKGSKSKAKRKSRYPTNPRLENLSPEDQEMFNALSSAQKKDVKYGQIRVGYNAWMVELALGRPYYKSENRAHHQDYEQVWLYVKSKETATESEKQVFDEVTGGQAVKHVTKLKTCKVGDFFVRFDRGVVEKIVPDQSEKTYGSCTIDITEEMIPLKP